MTIIDIKDINRIIVKLLYKDDNTEDFISDDKVLSKYISIMAKNIKINLEKYADNIDLLKISLESYLNKYLKMYYLNTFNKNIKNPLFIKKEFHINEMVDYLVLEFRYLYLYTSLKKKPKDQPQIIAAPVVVDPDLYKTKNIYNENRKEIDALMSVELSWIEQVKNWKNNKMLIMWNISHTHGVSLIILDDVFASTVMNDSNPYFKDLIRKLTILVTKQRYISCNLLIADIEEFMESDSSINSKLDEINDKCREFITEANIYLDWCFIEHPDHSLIFKSYSERLMCYSITDISDKNTKYLFTAVLNEIDINKVNLLSKYNYHLDRQQLYLEIERFNFKKNTKNVKKHEIYIDDYPSVMLIGQGSFGAVYLIPDPKGWLIMKTFNTIDDFRTEEELLKKLNADNFDKCNLIKAKALSIGNDTDSISLVTIDNITAEVISHIIIMEYAPTIDMYTIHNSPKPKRMDFRNICNVIFSLLKNFKCLQDNNYIYQDFKCQNILWKCMTDDYKQIMIGDLGDILDISMNKTNRMKAELYYLNQFTVTSYPAPEVAFQNEFLEGNPDITVEQYYNDDFILWGVCIIVLQLFNFMSLPHMLAEIFSELPKLYMIKEKKAAEKILRHVAQYWWDEAEIKTWTPKILDTNIRALWNGDSGIAYIFNEFKKSYSLKFREMITSGDDDVKYLEAIKEFLDNTLKLKYDNKNVRGNIQEHMDKMENVLKIEYGFSDKDGII